MSHFQLWNSNILSKKELHSSLWVGMFEPLGRPAESLRGVIEVSGSIAIHMWNMEP